MPVAVSVIAGLHQRGWEPTSKSSVESEATFPDDFG